MERASQLNRNLDHGTAATTASRSRSGRRRSRVWWLAAGLVFSLLALEVGSFYFWTGAPVFVRRTAAVLQLPVAKVNGSFITEGALERDRKTLATFVQFQATQAPDLFSQDLGEEELAQVALDRLVHNAIIEQLAAARGVEVDRAALDADFAAAVGDADLARVAEQLEAQFGLTIEQYKRLVVRYALLRDALERSIAFDDTINADLTSRAEEVYERVQESDEAFDDLAAQYSDDASTRLQGGDLGYVREGEVDPDLFSAARALEPGERSGLVRTAQGFHIIELIESVPPDADGTTVLHPRHILIRAKSVDAWIAEQLASARVGVFHPELSWNAETSRVVIRGQDGQGS